MRGRRRDIAEALLRRARIEAGIQSADPLDIGKMGLNSRPSRDEDAAYVRLRLDDSSSLIMRDYTTTARRPALQQGKETIVLQTLRDAGLPVPQILASVAGDHAATLLSDAGGEPLEEVFLSAPKSSRAALWSEVGSALRKWHEVDTTGVRFPQIGTLAWQDFVPHLITKLRRVKAFRPDLAPAVDAFVTFRRPLQSYLDTRPRVITFSGAMGAMPGMLLRRDRQRWDVTSWLGLGFHVTIKDPARDVVAIAVSHREWIGDPLPSAFWRSYGSRPDPICQLVYEANLLVALGASYQRGPRRAHPRPYDFPLPHSVAIRALEEFPQTVLRLQSLLADID